MMNLKQIVQNIEIISLVGDESVEVNNLPPLA